MISTIGYLSPHFSAFYIGVSSETLSNTFLRPMKIECVPLGLNSQPFWIASMNITNASIVENLV